MKCCRCFVIAESEAMQKLVFVYIMYSAQSKAVSQETCLKQKGFGSRGFDSMQAFRLLFCYKRLSKVCVAD